MAGLFSRTPRTSDLLTSVLTVQIVFALTAGAALIIDPAGVLHHPALQVVASSLVVVPIVVAGYFARRFIHGHRLAKASAQGTSDLMDTVLRTSRDWVWALDTRGHFTFSNPASATLLGYEPHELIGRPCSLVIDMEDLVSAHKSVKGSLESDGTIWDSVIARCRHRDGSAVWVEVSGTSRAERDGRPGSFEGTSRPIPPQSAKEAAEAHSRARILEMIESNVLLTAFQPIRDLASGNLIGVESLTRFVSDDGAGPEFWFKEAAAVGLGSELEFAALEKCLEAAQGLPAGIYVALNISPATCLDPRLAGFFHDAPIPLNRLVLELTEQLAVEEYTSLTSALAPLRHQGLRIAVDDAGSGFASMRHVLQIKPDIIKLDRSLIAGIDDDQGQRALGAAMVEFARQIGASLLAEGIETQAELEAVTRLGMTAGQGYHLGRPSVHPPDWAAWRPGISATEER